ncbi:ribonuclease H-like domain-containing protein [Tanacetum coccineum]
MDVGDSSGSVELISNLDAGNPLYMQSNDNTGLAIVNVKLIGAENYKMWATAMKIALKGKNKIGFIDGTCVKQDSSVVLSQQWERRNAIVLDLSVSDYYHKLNSLGREFDILTILLTCVCEGRTACTCDAKFGSVKHTLLIILMQILMGLNDVYQQIKSTVLAKDPLSNVKDAFYVVSREESNKGLHPGGLSRNNNKRFNANYEVNQLVPSTSGFLSSSFTHEQMMKLLSLINENPSPADSGANQHMTDSTKDMFNVVDISSLML